MPDGRKIELKEVDSRQLVVPTGATMHVPENVTWIIKAMSVLPRPSYAPPGTEARDPRFWGDVQIRLRDRAYFRTGALTLMDRYWGRYSLNPELPEAVAKLEQAQHAVLTAPRIPDLAIALAQGAEAARAYIEVAAPMFPQPIIVPGDTSFTVEHLDCAVQAEDEVLRKPGYLDVELLLMVQRPVY